MKKFILFLANTETTDTSTQSTFDWGKLWNEIIAWITTKGIQIALTIVVLIILFKLVNLISKKIRKKMQKRNADKTVTNLVYYLLNKGVKFCLLFIAISTLGINTASIAAAFAAAGLGIGLAVQGALSNLAGGIIILIMRPFKIDDYIEGQGLAGTVEDIHIFYTYLCTPDNKVCMVPNGNLANGNIVNYSAKPLRRLDLIFSIDYDENFMKAEQIILQVCKNHAFVLKNPDPIVRINEWADSSIDLTARVWVKTEDYWNVRFDLLEDVFVALTNAGISIPYNQIQLSYRTATEEKKENINEGSK